MKKVFAIEPGDVVWLDRAAAGGHDQGTVVHVAGPYAQVRVGGVKRIPFKITDLEEWDDWRRAEVPDAGKAKGS